ncbi:MAG TPA: hypothetical protein VN667_18220 [Burkholderiales bacterium]|nr:hypothetical protein [Burkholderiales bacterium]
MTRERKQDVHLDEDELAELESGIAEADRGEMISGAELFRRLEKRKTLQEAAINAWNEYQNTGRYLTEEEADTWLRTLESGRDTEPPTPKAFK